MYVHHGHMIVHSGQTSYESYEVLVFFLYFVSRRTSIVAADS